MSLLDCCPLKSITRATAKAAAARFRSIGLSKTAVNWQARAEICERCPMRVIQCGKSYCGKPYLQLINRDQGIDGCGCPTIDKAKDATEHCPIDVRHRASVEVDGKCNCKWCVQTRNER